MNDCVNAEVRDALPDLVHERLSELDTATMKAHVEACATCRAELALLGEVRSSAPLAPKMDVVRLVAALPSYAGAAVLALSLHEKPARFSRHSLWMVAVASLLVAVGGTAVIRNGASPLATRAVDVASAPGVATPAAHAAPSAERASRQLASLSLVGGVQDLSDTQIEALLSQLDGVESLPSAEPQSVTIPLDDLEGGI